MKKSVYYAVAAAAVLLVLLPFVRRRGHVLVLAAVSEQREVYGDLIPLFQKHRFETTGKRVDVRASFLSGGVQSRAIAAGFPADVAALSKESDLARLERAGLITRDWRAGKIRGITARSVVVIAVREGNPKDIRGWGDLARPGLELVVPHPKVSGDAQWNFVALYGAAERGAAPPYAAGDEAAFRFCRDVFNNVVDFDKGARESLLTFERGVGEAAVTRESDVLAARRAGGRMEKILPPSTLLIEYPAAVVDRNADRHGVRPEAEAFVQFLMTEEAQTVFARWGFRPSDRRVLARRRDLFPPVPDAMSVDEFGGWSEVGTVFFGPGGLFDQVMEDVHASRS